MGHHDDSFFLFSDNAVDIVGNSQPRLIIQGGKGFVQQQNLRACGQGADESGALPHAAGKLGGIFILEPIEPICPQQVFDVIGIFLRFAFFEPPGPG